MDLSQITLEKNKNQHTGTMIEIQTPLCIFMVGIPYSGKSTFIARHPWLSGMPVLSLDDEVMTLTGSDYSRWAEVVSQANQQLEEKLNSLIAQHHSFVIDKTNVTKIERQALIARLKETGYRLAAIVLDVPDEAVLKERILKRTQKKIPTEVMERMKANYFCGLDSLTDEFDSVLFVDSEGKIRLIK